MSIASGWRWPESQLCLLDADPDLGQRLSSRQFSWARERLMVPVRTLAAGSWHPAEREFDVDGLGLLVIDGVLRRRVTLAGRARSELLGPGDVLRPWRDEDEHGCVATACDWVVVEPTVVALLDADLTAKLAAWPSLLAEVVARAALRSHRLTQGMAIANVSGVAVRLQLLFWHLADRWGRVESAGVVLALRLSQEIIGELVAATRTRVNKALGELEREGALRRHPAGWLLRERPPELLLKHVQAMQA